ncbi:MAG: ABC transporter ATP-binding protein [Candidatus Nomurabacteria bacterium]|jgi:putative ABC transport system ATP-binding protein|nr:ABC transporter ATP-binding protein [Candidatus Nomurabacteria bacterium]
MSTIVVANVTKTYKKKKEVVRALSGIDLTVDEGEFLVIKGESGSGKSTLLSIIGGLEAPTSGQVLVNGEDIPKLNDNRLSAFRGSTIGFVFQGFHLHPYLTLRQNIELPAMFAGVSLSERYKNTDSLAVFLGLGKRLSHLPSELSGGQIQRAAILRAVYNRPSIILADEPTGNLDKKNSLAVLELLKKINQELKATVVLATHDSLADGYADRCLAMKDISRHED